jgi:hypothetical protein
MRSSASGGRRSRVCGFAAAVRRPAAAAGRLAPVCASACFWPVGWFYRAAAARIRLLLPVAVCYCRGSRFYRPACSIRPRRPLMPMPSPVARSSRPGLPRLCRFYRPAAARIRLLSPSPAWVGSATAFIARAAARTGLFPLFCRPLRAAFNTPPVRILTLHRQNSYTLSSNLLRSLFVLFFLPIGSFVLYSFTPKIGT